MPVLCATYTPTLSCCVPLSPQGAGWIGLGQTLPSAPSHLPLDSTILSFRGAGWMGHGRTPPSPHIFLICNSFFQGCRVDGPWLDAALSSFTRQMHEAKAHDLVTMLDTVGVQMRLIVA